MPTLDLELCHVYGRTDSTGLRRRLKADRKDYTRMGDLAADGRTVLKSSETLATLHSATRGHITRT
jgi:hypothetical protein